MMVMFSDHARLWTAEFFSFYLLQRDLGPDVTLVCSRGALEAFPWMSHLLSGHSEHLSVCSPRAS